MARPGAVGHGKARRGFKFVTSGLAWLGVARQGKARQGEEVYKKGGLKVAIKICEFTVQGISNILMHNPASMRSGGDTSVAKKKIPTPEVEAAAAVYRNGGKGLVVPSVAFKSSLLRGCSGKRIGKVSAVGQIAAGVFEVEPYTALIDPKTKKPLTEYRVHVARVVVQKNGIMRARAEVGPWMAIVAFELDDDFVVEQQVRELFNIAGRIAGIGDWRPEKKGRFGRYLVQ